MSSRSVTRSKERLKGDIPRLPLQTAAASSGIRDNHGRGNVEEFLRQKIQCGGSAESLSREQTWDDSTHMSIFAS